MTEATSDPDLARFVAALRPKLHRYCARMTGSVIDGEDVVQDTLEKAVRASPRDIANPEGWLFRIAHRSALDLLRRRKRRDLDRSSEDVNRLPAIADVQRISPASLGGLMRLPAMQRSAVILMDVLGYSLDEIAAIVDATIPAVKAALHRGRTRLRELAGDSDVPPILDEHRALVAAYVERFNAHDFAAVRDMLAEDVRLELVARTRMHGRAEVSSYFHNYSGAVDWELVVGYIDGRLAALARDPATAAWSYFVLLDWRDGKLAAIRDFRYARYVMDGAVLRSDRG